MSTSSFQPDDELLSAYIDGQLTADEVRAVEQWIERDPAARAMVDELRQVSAMVQALPTEPLPAAWSAQLAERLDRAAVNQQPPVNNNRGNDTPAVTVGRSSRGWWYSAAAIAAAVAVVAYTHFMDEDAPPNMALKAPVAGGEVASSEVEEAETADEVDDLPELHAAVPEPAAEREMFDADSDFSGIAGNEFDDRSTASGMLAESSRNFAREMSPAIRAAADVSNTYLIVWADVPPAALREQQINHVLGNNGIEIEDRIEDWPASAEPVRQQIELRNNPGNNARDSDSAAADRFGSFAGGGFGGRGASSRFSVPNEEASERPVEETNILARKRSGKSKDDSEEVDGEAILVEATADQLAACLAEMEQDTGNYTAITVEPVQQTVVAEQLADAIQMEASQLRKGGQVEQGEADRQLQEWRIAPLSSTEEEAVEQASEGIVDALQQAAQAQRMPRARRLDLPNQWYYDNKAPQDASYAYQVRGADVTSDGAKANAKAKAVKQFAGKQSQLENINRFLSTQKSESQVPQQLLSEQQPVQVLFVLRNSDLPNPVAEAPAAEVAPAESP